MHPLPPSSQQTAYEDSLVDQLIRYKSAKAQATISLTPKFDLTGSCGHFDLNDSDCSDDESPAKHQRRFDLNDSDSSEDESSKTLGSLAMMQGSSSSIAPEDYFTTEEYQAWLRTLPPGALGRDVDPPTSDDFKAWRILYRQTAVHAGPSDMDRRVARERRLRQRETAQTRRDQDASEQPDDEYMFDDELRASAPLSASGLPASAWHDSQDCRRFQRQQPVRWGGDAHCS